MVDAAAGTCQAYNADDFEGAAERLLGKPLANGVVDDKSALAFGDAGFPLRRNGPLPLRSGVISR